MQKFIISVLLLAAAIKFGGGYLLSEDFERWADQKKAPWTCQLENAIAGIHEVRNDYDRAFYRYSHTLDRCPNSELAEEAQFETARCLEQMGRRHDAYLAYDQFLKDHPASHLARAAQRATEILHAS